MRPDPFAGIHQGENLYFGGRMNGIMLDESVGNGLCAVPYEMDEPYTAQFAAEQMSTGHLHEMVRVPPDTSKTGHPDRATRCRYARRDSLH